MEHLPIFTPPLSPGKERRSRTMLDFALLYANEGMRILPIHSLHSPDCCTCGREECRSMAKHPITHQGVKDTTGERADQRMVAALPAREYWDCNGPWLNRRASYGEVHTIFFLVEWKNLQTWS